MESLKPCTHMIARKNYTESDFSVRTKVGPYICIRERHFIKNKSVEMVKKISGCRGLEGGICRVQRVSRTVKLYVYVSYINCTVLVIMMCLIMNPLIVTNTPLNMSNLCISFQYCYELKTTRKTKSIKIIILKTRPM